MTAHTYKIRKYTTKYYKLCEILFKNLFYSSIFSKKFK